MLGLDLCAEGSGEGRVQASPVLGDIWGSSCPGFFVCPVLSAPVVSLPKLTGGLGLSSWLSGWSISQIHLSSGPIASTKWSNLVWKGSDLRELSRG